MRGARLRTLSSLTARCAMRARATITRRPKSSLLPTLCSWILRPKLLKRPACARSQEQAGRQTRHFAKLRKPLKRQS